MTAELLKSLCETKESFFRDELCNNNQNSKRLDWITKTIQSRGISYELDTFKDDKCVFTNIILKGSSNLFFTAHYDILNIKSDNANDNSASIINLIRLKTLAPHINVIFFDGEEPPFFGIGSAHFAKNPYKTPDYVLNLELTGYGNGVLISDLSNDFLNKTLISKFNATPFRFPINDAVIIKKINPKIDTETIVLAPIKENGQPNVSHFHNIHSLKDSLNSINIDDMNNFIHNILFPLTKIK